MVISGTSITSYHVKVLPNFKPITKLAIQWIQLASGNWVGTDRGSTADTYEAQITIAGKQAVVEQFITEVEANRTSDTHTFTLNTFDETEHIFGEDIDYGADITATALEYGNVKQSSWKVYSMDVTLRAISPTFTGASTLPAFTNVRVGYTKNLEKTIKKQDTYYSSYTYTDGKADVGVLELDWALPLASVKTLRRYVATQRTATISIPSMSGIWNPLGNTRNAAFPLSVKILKCEDAGAFGLTHRIQKLQLAEVA